MKRRLPLKYTFGLIALLGVVVGGVAGYSIRPTTSVATNAPSKDGRRVLYWHDPMVPGYRSNKPGKSPFMDMQLVPVYEGEEAKGVIKVRPEIASSLGIRTYRITPRTLQPQLQAEGYLQADTNGGLRAVTDLYDPDAYWIRSGLTATIHLAGNGGASFPAAVSAVQSDVDAGWRGVRVWLRLRARDSRLRANQPVTINIFGPAHKGVLAIPREALIRTGQRSTVVVQVGKGEFQVVEVRPGQEFGDWVAITRGVREGMTVVTSGQFLIDSEANIRAGSERLNADPPPDRATPAARETKP